VLVLPLAVLQLPDPFVPLLLVLVLAILVIVRQDVDAVLKIVTVQNLLTRPVFHVPVAALEPLNLSQTLNLVPVVPYVLVSQEIRRSLASPQPLPPPVNNPPNPLLIDVCAIMAKMRMRMDLVDVGLLVIVQHLRMISLPIKEQLLEKRTILIAKVMMNFQRDHLVARNSF